jgi:hypothetical protein
MGLWLRGRAVQMRCRAGPLWLAHHLPPAILPFRPLAVVLITPIDGHTHVAMRTFHSSVPALHPAFSPAFPPAFSLSLPNQYSTYYDSSANHGLQIPNQHIKNNTPLNRTERIELSMRLWLYNRRGSICDQHCTTACTKRRLVGRLRLANTPGGGLVFKTTGVASGSPCQDMHVATSVYRLLDNQTLSSILLSCVPCDTTLSCSQSLRPHRKLPPRRNPSPES